MTEYDSLGLLGTNAVNHFSPEAEEIYAFIGSFPTASQGPGEMLNSAIYYYSTYQAYGRGIDIYRSLKNFRAVIDALQADHSPEFSQLALEQLYALMWLNKQFADLRLVDANARAEQLLHRVDNHFLALAEALFPPQAGCHSGTMATLLRYGRLRMQAPAVEAWLAALPQLIDAGHSPSGAARGASLALSQPERSPDLASGRAGLALQCLKLFASMGKEEAFLALARCNIIAILGTLRPVNFSEHRFSSLACQINREAGHIYSNELTWQTGDAGIALLLYEASIVLHDQELVHLADLIGLSTLLRKDSSATGITTPELLTGSAGIALLYQKLHHASGNPAYRVGNDYWLAKTQAWAGRDLANGSLRPGPGLLEGVVGTGLVLLSAATGKDLSWGEVLSGT